MKKRCNMPIILSGAMLFFSILFGSLLGAGLAATRNTINTENFTDFKTALPTKLLDINGELITEFASDERREIIALKNLPQHMIDALLTREDRIFYSHHGFSVKAIFRAVVGVLTRKSLGGGSTLTQQIAGTLYCDRQQYSPKRKLKELWWAIQMERRYSKDEILEIYLNKIFFGGGTYGVNAASKYYFGHAATEITPAESAILVIQLSNPSFYNPFNHPNRAMARQKDVLEAMVDLGYISREEADDSFDNYWAGFDYTRTNTSAHAMQNDEAPWFSEYVRRSLSQMIYGAEDIYTSGFTVNTTLNLSHQKAAEQIMQDYIYAANRIYQKTMNSHERSALSKYIPLTELLSLVFNLPDLKLGQQRNQAAAMSQYRDKINPMIDVMSMICGIDTLKTEIVNRGNSLIQQKAEKTTIEGTMIAIENSTGYIDALVGGSKYDNSNQFIRAVQAKLQPGSTFKPLYYAEAIESQKFTMTTIISDTPQVFHNEDGTPYIPQDFKGEWEGDVEFWYALAHSMNVPSIKVLDTIGFDAAIKRTSSLLGIPQNEFAERNFVPLYPFGLGVCSVRPIEIAKAYATIANRGKEVKPIAILSIEDKNGNEILSPGKDYANSQKARGASRQIISEETAFIMQEIMKNTVNSGTLRYGADWDSTYWVTGKNKGKGNKFTFVNSNGKTFQMPVAGKTGTTQNWADAWAAGFTPYYTAVFWFGFDKPGQSLGLRITGSTLAGVAWGDYMNAANQGKSYKPFFDKIPENLVQAEVCTRSGGLLTPECGGNRITAYYYPGTEPTEPCVKHTDDSGRTLGTVRLKKARLRSGYSFDETVDDTPLTVDLSFLSSGKHSSEREKSAPEYENTQRRENSDDFSNWLLD
ncbi:penicillin-binding protein 1A [Treponema sp.]|uniref:penicillin-binding protein 1A n=1 Tax=Treponema sp. TaxID=166 RepID=UPI003EFF6D96